MALVCSSGSQHPVPVEAAVRNLAVSDHSSDCTNCNRMAVELVVVRRECE